MLEYLQCGLYWNICEMSYVIGYARTSTVDQAAGFEAQKRELTAAGCRRIFEEQVSSLAQRAQLEAAIAYLREGDVLVVTSLDRLARSMCDLIALVDRIRAIGASLRILNMNLDTSNATGELILNVIGSVAQWERMRMLERQAEGIATAKAKGKYKGRAPTARRKSDQVHALSAQGLGMTAIARQLGIGRTSVYRILNGDAL
jgi:DNA invertase Pin-like site-specific DNA recombinase